MLNKHFNNNENSVLIGTRKHESEYPYSGIF